MSWLLVLTLQAAAPAPAPAPEDFDLARLRPIEFTLAPQRGGSGCADAAGAEILVCGRRRRDGDYRYGAWAREFEEQPLRAETRLFGAVTGAIHGESVGLDRGAISHRVMLRIRVPF